MPKEKKKKIAEIDGPCKDCLVLALCKQKTWFNVMSECDLLRVSLCKYGQENAVRLKSCFVKVLYIDKEFSMYRQKMGKDTFMVGPR